MSLLNPAILFGLGLVAIPVILHLLLRQKPKKLIFPAMQLIQNRRKQNVRRMRLRHIWLLLLRMLVLGLLVLAIARPSLPAADYGLSPRELFTFCGVIVAAVVGYSVLVARWRKRLPRYESAYRRSMLRGWMTGLTLLLLLPLVAWPYQRRIAAEIKAPPPDVELDLPVAAVFLFDTSLSMQYQQESRTRLDVAKELALEHLSTFPGGSRVAIADVSNDNPVLFQATLGAAKSRIESTETAPLRIPFNDRLRDALRAQIQHREELTDSTEPDAAAKDRFLRRIYIFTDLAATGWRMGGTAMLRAEIENLAGMPVFLVDVGELDPQNVAVTEITLSANRVSLGGSLVAAVTVDAEGAVDGTRMLEFSYSDGDGEPVLHDKMEVVLDSGTAQRVEFRMLSGLTGPVVHGDIRIVASDPLEFDDARSFTVTVGAPTNVLVVAPEEEEGKIWTWTLDAVDARFGVSFAPADRLPRIELEQYDVVCLINIPVLADETWYKLGQYVDGGGGLGVFLGHEDPESISPVSYNRGQAQAFLPARLDVWTTRHVPGSRLNLDPITHPIYRIHRDRENYSLRAVLENEAEIYKFWKVVPAESAAVLATYTDPDRSPAILERLHGKGRVLMFTTDVDLKSQNNRWNTLPNLVNWFAWKALADQMIDYLARTSDYKYTYDVGERPVLDFEPAGEDRQLLIRRPDLTQDRHDLPAGAAELSPPASTVIGHHDIADSGNSLPITGFSLNPSSAESDLTRLTEEELNELLGEDRYQIARDIDQLKAEINISDFGKEVFPIVLLVAIIAFCGEHLVANRFYEQDSSGGDVSPGSSESTPVTAPSSITATSPESSVPAGSELSESTASTV